MYALQAAVVTVKLQHLDKWTEARQNNAARYEALFRQSGLQVVTSRDYQPAQWQNAALNKGSRCVVVPAIVGGRHIFNQFVIRVPRRNELKAWLKQAGIDTEIYYPLPLHLQECFRYLGCHQGDFPVSERAAEETLALPVYPELSDAQAQ